MYPVGSMSQWVGPHRSQKMTSIVFGANPSLVQIIMKKPVLDWAQYIKNDEQGNFTKTQGVKWIFLRGFLCVWIHPEYFPSNLIYVSCCEVEDTLHFGQSTGPAGCWLRVLSRRVAKRSCFRTLYLLCLIVCRENHESPSRFEKLTSPRTLFRSGSFNCCSPFSQLSLWIKLAWRSRGSRCPKSDVMAL